MFYLRQKQRTTKHPNPTMEDLYDTGKVQNPPIAAVTANSFLYLAWAIRSQGAYHSQFVGKNTGMFYCSAAHLTLDIVAWTLTVMMSTNYQLVLIAGAEAKASVSEEEFDGLMGRWQVFNGIRGLFPLAGGVSGLVVALC